MNDLDACDGFLAPGGVGGAAGGAAQAFLQVAAIAVALGVVSLEWLFKRVAHGIVRGG